MHMHLFLSWICMCVCVCACVCDAQTHSKPDPCHTPFPIIHHLSLALSLSLSLSLSFSLSLSLSLSLSAALHVCVRARVCQRNQPQQTVSLDCHFLQGCINHMQRTRACTPSPAGLGSKNGSKKAGRARVQKILSPIPPQKSRKFWNFSTGRGGPEKGRVRTRWVPQPPLPERALLR